LLSEFGTRLGRRFQKPQQEGIAALFAIASLVAHTGDDSMLKQERKSSASQKSSRTRISFIPDPDYWLALGEFVESFAFAEISLFSCMAATVGISHSVAKAVVGGQHADQLITVVRRVWQVKPPDEDIRQKVNGALTQLALINEIRGSVVHYPSFDTDDKGRVSSNVSRALTLTQRHHREVRVSPNVLKDLSADLKKISQHLTYAAVATLDHRTPRAELAGRLPALADAWRYKRDEDQSRSKPTRKERRRQR
jgi:hypothetical protein